jgi:hypothetical protein
MDFLPQPGLRSIAGALPNPADLDTVVGVAIFDLNGLPKEYLIAMDEVNIDWVQTVFQALGLQHLLTTALNLGDFRHATLRDEAHCTVVVQRPAHYIALLVNQKDAIALNALIAWVHTCDLTQLKRNPRFRRS